MTRTFAVAAVLAAASLAACGRSEAPADQAPPPAAVETASVTGTATYRERIALPADAEMIVQLADVSLADAPSTVIAEQRIAPVKAPTPFTLAYDPAKIDPRHTYAVSARVERGGKLLFTTDTQHRVLTQGAGQSADITMVKVRSH